MEYTTNYHLPQWVESDRIMMGDFNQMCSDLEAGLVSNAQAAAAAQETADTAQETADSAYSPTNKPYVIGSYTGNGGTVTVTLGFRPTFLIIGGGVTASSPGYHSKWSVITNGTVYTDTVTFTDTGFTTQDPGNSYLSPNLAEGGRAYSYIAFR